MKYSFQTTERCNMCAAGPAGQSVLGKRLNRSQGFSPRTKLGISTTVCRCGECGLVYANPLPIPHDIQDHYGVPPEDYWTEQYFEVDPKYFLGEMARLQRLMDVRPGMTSLDIGAGLGKQMKSLQRLGFDTHGLEPSREFHDRAISRMGITPSQLKCARLEDADYPEESFDFISFGVVLEHLYDPSDSLRRALRWLKPNGLIHVEVPSSDWLTGKLINLIYRLRGLDYVGNISPMHPPYHLYEFSLQSFLMNAKLNGYDVVFHEYYVCKTFLPKVLDRLAVPYMRRTGTGMQLCVWLRKSAASEDNSTGRRR
jgi:2-polyprenyl-3-methyl-5-hydroxy-6-metoxy-1,4-benzoquinol methylase